MQLKANMALGMQMVCSVCGSGIGITLFSKFSLKLGGFSFILYVCFCACLIKLHHLSQAVFTFAESRALFFYSSMVKRLRLIFGITVRRYVNVLFCIILSDTGCLYALQSWLVLDLHFLYADIDPKVRAGGCKYVHTALNMTFWDLVHSHRQFKSHGWCWLEASEIEKCSLHSRSERYADISFSESVCLHIKTWYKRGYPQGHNHAWLFL